MTALSAPPQHETARMLANEHRGEKARLRAWVTGTDQDRAAGYARLATLIDPVPACLARTELLGAKHQLLKWPHRVQRPDAVRMLRRIGASETQTLGGLTTRQRMMLLAILTDHTADQPLP